MLFEPSRTKYDLSWRVSGIPVRVNPFFWLVAALLGWGDDIAFLELLVWIGCVLISILIHEMGHAIAARRFGATDVGVVLFAMGGVTNHQGGLRGRARVIQLLSGPGAGFAVYLVVLALMWIVPTERLNPYIVLMLIQLEQINLVWGLLNLVPAYPLDGGQILMEWMKIKRPWDGLEVSIKISMIVSTLAAFAFTTKAIWTKFHGNTADWFPIFVFAGLAMMNYQIYRAPSVIDGPSDTSEPRSPWEKDPDWWKR